MGSESSYRGGGDISLRLIEPAPDQSTYARDGEIANLYAENADLRTKLTEAESRALQAVAREAELTADLEKAAGRFHETAMALHKDHPAVARVLFDWDADTRAALSSTSPRAKQLLAIEADAVGLAECYASGKTIDQIMSWVIAIATKVRAKSPHTDEVTK